MDRRIFGALGGLLAAAAAIRTGTSPGEARKVAQVNSTAAGAAGLQAPRPDDTRESDGPWKACSRYFGPGASGASKKLAGDPWSSVPENTQIAFLIASVPDPKTTNLALYFDRIVESLMGAIGDSGYSFEQYWLPWDNLPEMPLVTYADWNSRRAELEKLAEQPGILIFRRRAEAKRTEPVFIAFLVPETPAGGISKPAFANALADLQAIAKRSCNCVEEILLAGPTFSGSLGPLAGQLSPFLQKNPHIRFSIVSGHVTSQKAIKRFRDSAGEEFARVDYKSSIENDERASKFFFDYVNERWSHPHEVAILSEDETAYGYISSELSKALDREEKLLLRYPRQISRLRNAYQDRNASEQDRPGSSVVEGVRLTLKDASDTSSIQLPKDTIDDLSEQQSPASQQAALAQIAMNLRREKVDYTGIFATDILDSLFLSRYLRLSFPDNRIFTFDADLLFVSEGETAPFTGILSVTNYPLFGRNQHWTNAQLAGGVPRRVQFTSRYAEAMYNACRYLIQKDIKGWDESKDGEFLLEYSRPTSPPGKRPALWLTALGRDGYWPVALLDSEKPSPTVDRDYPSGLLDSPYEPKGGEDLHPERPSRAWFILFWLVMLYSLAHCLYVLLLMCQPLKDPDAPGEPQLVYCAQCVDALIVKLEKSSTPLRTISSAFCLARDSCRKLSMILRPYPDPNYPLTGYEIPFLLSASLALACLVFLLSMNLQVFSTGHPNEGWSGIYRGIARLTLIALTALSVGLMVRSRRLKVQLEIPKTGTQPADSKISGKEAIPIPISSLRQYAPLTMLAIAFSTWFCLAVLLLTLASKYQTGYFFAYRSLSLTSGVSPAAPLLLLAAVYFYWAWIHLLRESMIRQRRSTSGFESNILDPKALQHVRRVDECLSNLFSAHVWRPALLFFFSWFLVLQPWYGARSIDGRIFEWLYVCELALLYWMLSVVWSQFIWCWRHFRKFLQWLERNPVHNAFSRLRKETSWVPLVSRPREHQLFISSRALDTLRALRAFEAATLPSDQEKAGLLALQSRLCESGTKADAVNAELEDSLAAGKGVSRESYGELQRCLEAAAAEVRKHLEMFAWKTGDSDSARRELDSVEKEKPTATESLLVLEEEFVAYRYLMYIRYVFRHLRNLLMFVIVGFIFSVISLHSYPFLALRWIGVVCWLVLLTLGTGVGMVFAQMDRDAILSRLTETKANEVGINFFLRMLQFGALPLLTLLTTQFPAIGRLVSSWLQPALQALR